MKFDITGEWADRPHPSEWAAEALPKLATWLDGDTDRGLGGNNVGHSHDSFHLTEDPYDPYDNFEIGPICRDDRISASPLWGGLPNRFTICDRCLRKIGVDTKQEETALEWGLKNFVEPWKVLDLLEAPGLWKQDKRRIWDRWYTLKIGRGEWSEDWRHYDRRDHTSILQDSDQFTEAGFSNPYNFAEHVLGWYSPTGSSRGQPQVMRLLKEWNGPNRVSMARRLERLHWLWGWDPPKPEQVASKAEAARQILALRDRRWELLKKLENYRGRGLETPFAPRDDRRDPLFADLV